MAQDRTEPCGCVNHLDPVWQVPRRVLTCKYHLRHAGRGGEEYYTRMGVWKDERPAAGKHLTEIHESLGSWPPPDGPAGNKVLEVGCGVSPYAAELARAGWDYLGLDPDPWAVACCRRQLPPDAEVLEGKFPQAVAGHGPFGFVLACHVVEHLEHAPEALLAAYALLRPAGRAWVVVPDDSDMTNPDHVWFFTLDSLVRTLRRAGFVGVRAVERRVVDHEMFLYAEGVRPCE